MAQPTRTLEQWTAAIAEEAARWRALHQARGYPHPARRLRKQQSALKLGLLMRQACAEHPAEAQTCTLALLRALGLDEPPDDRKSASWRRF